MSRKSRETTGPNEVILTMTESNPRAAVERIAAFTASARPGQLTNETRQLFKRNILDSIGCAIAALPGQPFQALREQFEEYRAPGRCTLIGGGNSSADQAALFNSGLVRYVDLLDSYMAPGGLCHPSDNFGTVLAAAEQAGASGEDFMLGLAIAYEIQCRFSAAVPVMAKGFNHATQLAISAAASAGKLLGLTAVEIANAIAIATVDNISLACVHAEPVSQWKGFSPGMTGMRAIYAASLAKRGFEGPSGLFEGPDGLERMFGQPIHVDWDDPSLEIVNQTVLKKYCSLIHGQPVLEAVLDLKRGNGLVSANIKRVHCDVFQGRSISRGVVAMVRRIIPRPKSKPTTISNTSSQRLCSTIRWGQRSCNRHAFRRRMRRRCLRECRSVPMSVSPLVIPKNLMPESRSPLKTSGFL